MLSPLCCKNIYPPSDSIYPNYFFSEDPKKWRLLVYLSRSLNFLRNYDRRSCASLLLEQEFFALNLAFWKKRALFVQVRSENWSPSKDREVNGGNFVLIIGFSSTVPPTLILKCDVFDLHSSIFADIVSSMFPNSEFCTIWVNKLAII